MWKLPLLEARTSVTGAVDTDIVTIFQDLAKKAIPPKGVYAGLVDKFRKSDAFEAKPGSLQFIRFAEKGTAENVLFAGLGLETDLTAEKCRVAGGNAWSKLCAEKSKFAVVHLDTFFEMKSPKSDFSPRRCIKAFAEGLVLNAYQFKKHKSKAAEGEEYLG